MRDELEIIDVFERIRAFALAERPQLGEAFERRVSAFESDHPIRYYKERFLAGLSGWDAAQPSHLRELSRAVLRAEEEPEAFHREIVAEGPAPFYAKMGRDKRSRVARWLEAFNDLGDDPREAGRAFGAALRACGRLEEARVFVRSRFKDISPFDTYRVLKAWDYPVLLPDARRRSFLHRLGALTTKGAEADSMRAAAELAESIQRLTGMPLQTLDLLAGVFAGAERGFPIEIARCLPKPLCERCPVSSHCEFFKHRVKPRVAEHRPSIKEWDARQRPRERLVQHGSPQLSDAELLAILLRTGSSGASALELAQVVLQKFDGLKGLDEAALAELCEAKGLGLVKAVTLKAALELGRRLAGEAANREEAIASSFDVYHRFHARFVNLQQERFYLLCLNTKRQVTRESMVSQGTLSSSLVHPREAFKDAVRHSASAVIFVHNHPSGDPEPSRQDRELTDRLKEASEILGIPLLDHIIVGRQRYYSFTEGREFDYSKK